MDIDNAPLLYRLDPTRNMARFYALSIEITLFGEVALVRRWGRIGTLGRSRIEFCGSPAEAAEAGRRLLRRKLGRGYRPADDHDRDAALAAQG